MDYSPGQGMGFSSSNLMTSIDTSSVAQKMKANLEAAETLLGNTTTTTAEPFLTTVVPGGGDELTAFLTRILTTDSSLDNAQSSPTHPNYPYNMLGFTAACAFIISVLGSFGNLLTIIALPMSKKLRTSATAFVVNLAVAELLFCLFILPMSGAQYLYLQRHKGESLLTHKDCVFFTVTRYALTQAELQTILAIALTRAVAVSAPRMYSMLNRSSVIGTYIAFIWIYSFLLKLPPALGLIGQYGFNPRTMECDVLGGDLNARLILLIIEAVVPVLLIIFLYIFVFVMVIRRAVHRTKRFSKVFQPQPQVKESSARILGGTSNKTPTPKSSAPPSNSTDTPARKTSTSSLQGLKKMVSGSSLRDRIRRQSSNVSQRLRLARNKRDMRVARTIFIIFILILICGVPVTLVHGFDMQVTAPNRFLLLHVLYWFQYCLNMVVYVLMNRQYRDAYVDCLSHVFPRLQRHQGQRFFWEKPSMSSRPQQIPGGNTSARQRGDSANMVESGVSEGENGAPAVGGTSRVGGRLSDIPEGHSSSAASDSVLSEQQKKEKMNTCLENPGDESVKEETGEKDAFERRARYARKDNTKERMKPYIPDEKEIKDHDYSDDYKYEYEYGDEEEEGSDSEGDTGDELFLMNKEQWITINGTTGPMIPDAESKV